MVFPYPKPYFTQQIQRLSHLYVMAYSVYTKLLQNVVCFGKDTPKSKHHQHYVKKNG
jgi:hypothetical protein